MPQASRLFCLQHKKIEPITQAYEWQNIYFFRCDTSGDLDGWLNTAMQPNWRVIEVKPD